MPLRTIVIKRDGLQYVVPATQPTFAQRIAPAVDKLGKFIDRVLFAGLVVDMPAHSNKEPA